MKKGSFKITLNNGTQIEQEGFVSAHFGLHKLKGTKTNYYNITHLGSGRRMPANGLYKLADFKEFISRLEASDIPWGKPYNTIKKHGKKYFDIKITVINREAVNEKP